MQRKLIITTDKTAPKWRSMPAKLAFHKRVLNTIKGSSWTVEMQYLPLKPEVVDGKITHEWYDSISAPLLASGYDLVQIHYSLNQKQSWGIRSTLRGAYQIDKDEIGESYMGADEHTLREGLNLFCQTGLHEDSHFIARNSINVPFDLTHPWHAANPNIVGLFSTYDIKDFQPKRSNLKEQVSLLHRAIALYAQMNEPTYIKRLQPLVNRRAKLVLDTMELMGHEMRIVEGYRTNETQNRYYEQGRSTPGDIITNAKAGESFHNYGVAVDCVFRRDGYDASDKQWKLFGDVAKLFGFEHGMDWKNFVDKPHLQMTLGYSLDDFQDDKVDYSKFI